MKSPKTVQGLAKAGRILSTIVFVCSIVAGALCAIGALLTGIIGGAGGGERGRGRRGTARKRAMISIMI